MDDKDASMAGINEGDRITMQQVLYGLMLPSGADAANMIALHVGGSEEAFVEMMNREGEKRSAPPVLISQNTHGLTDRGPLHHCLRPLPDPAGRPEERGLPEIAGTPVYPGPIPGRRGKPGHQEMEEHQLLPGGKRAASGGPDGRRRKDRDHPGRGNLPGAGHREPGGELFYSVGAESPPPTGHLYRDMATPCWKKP